MSKDLTLTQVREKLATRQDELAKVFDQARVTTDSGQKAYDFNKVTCLGADVKGSIAVAEKVKAMNEELNELGSQAETLEAAEKAAGDHADRDKARDRFPMPGGKGNHASRGERIKSLGEMVTEEKAYGEWLKRGHPGGIDFSYDMLPSEVLAKGLYVDTLLTKALMTTAAGYAPESIRLPGFVDMVTRPLQLVDIIPLSQTGQAVIKYMEETTRTHAADRKSVV